MLKNTSKPKTTGNIYYVSASGSDTYTLTQARNPATPWKTINKVNQSFSAMTGSDSVLFKRGDTFSGATLAISLSGSSKNGFTIGAYGSGEKPIFTGMIPITNWVSIGGNLWEATLPVALQRLNIVTIDGVLKPIARYPRDRKSVV